MNSEKVMHNYYCNREYFYCITFFLSITKVQLKFFDVMVLPIGSTNFESFIDFLPPIYLNTANNAISAVGFNKSSR